MNLAEVDIMSVGMTRGTSAGVPASQRQENDDLFTIVESKTDNFDAQHFLLKLQQQLIQEVSNSGLKTSGGGGGGDTFHIEYESAEFKGGIDVIGIRAEKDKYRVWCVVRELDFGKTQKL
jgi:hypothetical protein